MGTPGAARGKSEDTIMGNFVDEIPPYRFNQLTKIASKVVDTMVGGALQMSYDEMEIVLNMIRLGIEESRDKNDKRKETKVCS